MVGRVAVPGICCVRGCKSLGNGIWVFGRQMESVDALQLGITASGVLVLIIIIITALQRRAHSYSVRPLSETEAFEDAPLPGWSGVSGRRLQIAIESAGVFRCLPGDYPDSAPWGSSYLLGGRVVQWPKSPSQRTQGQSIRHNQLSCWMIYGSYLRTMAGQRMEFVIQD